MSMSIHQRFSVLAAGLALFSMFFGAGDLIWPLILGGQSGDQNFFAMMGLLVTGVSLPLLGLIAMLLFEGDYHAFFGRLGKIPSILLIFTIQAILGPIGSIPRLMTLSFATLKPYLPEATSMGLFSLIFCIIVLGFTLKKSRVVDLLGLVLTPILLLSLGCILILGYMNHPEAPKVDLEPGDSFLNGLNVGYNTLDLIASFIFAPFVLYHFTVDQEELDPKEARRQSFKKMFKASLIAAFLLSVMYIGLTHVASWYTPLLKSDHEPVERLSLISMHLLGPIGGLISCIAVAMACLTTAIPLTSICADYIKDDILRNKFQFLVPLLLTLGISAIIATLGFSGIANMLSPILTTLCPGLIVLSVVNIIHKIYEIRVAKMPVYATFVLSTVGHLI